MVIDNGDNNYSIHPDDPMEAPTLRRVRRWPDDMQEDLHVISEEDELPMDFYNVYLRWYQDNLSWDMNYMGMHMDLMMKHLSINQPTGYPLS